MKGIGGCLFFAQKGQRAHLIMFEAGVVSAHAFAGVWEAIP